MSDSNNPAFPDFGKLVPGFDFLQNLTRQASSATQAIPSMPQLSNWVAPTLNVEELDKRIQELKAVQFWLDQNATALKATIQALEVQKMTLATLEGMNVSMNQMAEAFSIKPAETAAKPHHFDGLEVPETSYQKKGSASAESAPHQADKSARSSDESEGPSEDQTAAVPGLIDPLQWWGALTQQFQTIANSAMKEVSARTPAGADNDSLAQGMKAASDMAEQAGQRMAKTASDATDMMSSALRGEQAWPMPGNGAAKKGRSAAGKAASSSSRAGAKTSSKASAKAPAKAPARAAAKTSSKSAGAKAPAARKGTARTR